MNPTRSGGADCEARPISSDQADVSTNVLGSRLIEPSDVEPSALPS